MARPRVVLGTGGLTHGAESASDRVARIPLPLQTERLRLELPSGSRCSEVAKQLNDWEVARWLANTPYPYAIEDARTFVAGVRKRVRTGQALPLWIVNQTGDRLIGGIGLHLIDWRNASVELGYWLGREHWGKGFGTEAVRGLLPIAFHRLGLERVFAGVHVGNRRSEHLLRKCGFRLEGSLHHAHRRTGVWGDVRLLAVTADRLPAWLRRSDPG